VKVSTRIGVKNRALVWVALTGEKPGYHCHQLADSLQGTGLREADWVEEGTPADPQISPSVAELIEQRQVRRHRHWMIEIRIDNGGTEHRASSVLRELEECRPRRLVEQVVVDRDHLEIITVHQLRQIGIICIRPVGLERDAQSAHGF